MKSPTEARTPATGQTSANATTGGFPTLPPVPRFDEPDEFDPKQGIAGDRVTLNGQHFASVTTVLFDGKPISPDHVKKDNDFNIRVDIPDGATTGRFSLQSSFGTVTSAQEFKVIRPPVLDSTDPSSAPAGTKIKLIGMQLLDVKKADFSGTPAVIVEQKERSMKVIVPNVSPGHYTITVRDRAGMASIGFTVTP
jgi:IPT/TIG domain